MAHPLINLSHRPKRQKILEELNSIEISNTTNYNKSSSTAFFSKKKMVNLIKKIFQRYEWDSLSIDSCCLDDEKSTHSTIRVEVSSNKFSKNRFDFNIVNDYRVISKVDGDAIRTLYRIGNISNGKDQMMFENFIINEIETQRKGIKSELIAYNELVRFLSDTYIIRHDSHLDALSIDYWAQRKGTIEEGFCFQVKSSQVYIKRSIKKFEAKKLRTDLDTNPYVSLIKQNKLHHLIVENNNVFGLDSSNKKILLENYLKNIGAI